MVVTTVKFMLKPEHINDFIHATLKYRQCSECEPGNNRFDILQSDEEPAEFLLYEAFENEQQTDSNKETTHYKEWRKAISDWITIPEQSRFFNTIGE